MAWWKLSRQFIKLTSFPNLTRDPLPAKLETLGYTLISNQPTFSTSAKIQPVTHLEFLKLQTLVSPSFTVYHLGRERAVVLRTDARTNTASPNTTSAILYQGKWIYGHLAVSSLKSSPGGFSNMKHVKNRRARTRDALFSGDWEYIENGFENDIKDNFFQSHIKIKTSMILIQQPLQGPPKIGYDRETDIERKVEARLDESSSSTDSNKVNQIQTPRLKPSVSQTRKSFAAQFGMCLNKLTASKWIAKLGHEIYRKNGPAFLTWVLEFIKDEMLHPEREDGADCERIVDYFDRFVDNRVYEDWDTDL